LIGFAEFYPHDALHLQTELQMTMFNAPKYRSLRFVLLGYLALLSSASLAAEKAEPAHVCDRVAIASVNGDVGIWHDKIVGFSRLRGLTGPIIYVDVVAPLQSDSANKIRRMSLWWGAHPTASAVCKTGPDIGQRPAVNCAESVPETQLMLDITFEPEGAHDTETRTSELVKYVLGNVLCKLD
jgi:hypothetical protein